LITHWIVFTLVSKSFSMVGSATLIAEKSLAITTTLTPIASSASQVVRVTPPEVDSMARKLRRSRGRALSCEDE
jgi:hypothetical protein